MASHWLRADVDRAPQRLISPFCLAPIHELRAP